MADTVTNQTAFNGTRRKFVHLTGVSDGTLESGVIKIDRSGYTDSNGATPSTIAILSARWNIQGFSYVKLAWHHDADDVTAMVLSGNGYENYESFGGLRDTDTTNADAADGDIQLTSVGGSSGATYDITLEVSF
jgi:hypothetical protein